MKPVFDVGLDTRMLRHTGIGTYIRNVLAAFKEDRVFDRLRFGLFGTVTTRELFRDVPLREFLPKIYSISEQLVYPQLLSDCRLWHAPHYNIPLIRGKTRLIVTIHDLIHWIFRKQFFAPHQNIYAAVMLRAAVSISVASMARRDRHDRTPQVAGLRLRADDRGAAGDSHPEPLVSSDHHRRFGAPAGPPARSR